MVQSFNEWVALRENKQSTIWERHGVDNLPSIFRMTYYALPTGQQLDEFQQYPDLTAKDILQGFGYTIVGRGVDSPKNKQMVVDSIKMLVDKYPDNDVYKEALTLAKEYQQKKSVWGRLVDSSNGRTSV